MTRPPSKPITGQVHARAFAGLALTLALALVPAANLCADAPPTLLRIANTGPDTEGLPTFRLDWGASSNATYLVQSADSLAPDATWTTLDAVQPADKVGSYQVRLVATDSTGLSSAPAEFYRLVLPQPQIFSVEPAVVAPGVAVDFYVLGQCFPTNTVLQINGVTKSNAVVVSSSLATVPSFVPDLPGSYQFSLVVGGVVVSSFNVTCADPLANPELVLQGPPQNPPAGPEASVTFVYGEIKHVYNKQDPNGFLSPVPGNGGGGGGSGGNPPIVAGGKITKSRSNVQNNFMAGGGSDVDCDGIVARNGGQVKNGGIVINSGGSMRTAGGGDCDDNDPAIHPWSGELCDQVVDLDIPGRGLDFVWARTYNSRIGRSGTATNGWTFSYDVSCAQNSSGGIDVYDGTGRKDTFTLQADGTYTCPQFFREGTISNNTFTLTFADTGRWVFNPFDGSAAAGKLISIITRNGDTMTLGYDTSGRLAQIVDDLGRTNTVSYNSSGQLASVTDFSGRTMTYQYYQGGPGDQGGVGDLASVTSPPVTGTPDGNDFPDGKTTTYAYSTGSTNDVENHLLLSITDPKDQLAWQFTYSHDSTDPNYLHCTAVQRGKTPIERIDILALSATPANNFAVTRCIVNDPMGDVTEYYCDARNRCVLQRQFTGRATPGLAVTDTDNHPTGKLRDTDPDYYETQWTWNNDSLCTSETSPGGQQVQCVYQSDFDPATPARKRADCHVVREIASSAVDLDGDGVADVTDRSWYFDYDPRFGSDPSSMAAKPAEGTVRWHPASPSAPPLSNTRERVLDIENCLKNLGLLSRATGGKRFGIGDTSPANPLGRKGWDGTIKGLVVPDGNGMAIKTKGTGADKNRSLAGGDDADGDLWPDAFVTSMTDPRGNVTAGTYDANGNRVKVQFHWDRQSTADRDFAYNANGQCVAITNAPDANGHRRLDTFNYYTNGSQTGYLERKIEDDVVGITTSYEYDARGNVTRCVDSRGNDCLYTYNALDQCVQTQSPTNLTARCVTDYDYDADDNLIQSIVDVRDDTDTKLSTRITSFVYDQENRLVSVTEPISGLNSAVTGFAYDGDDQLTMISSPLASAGIDGYDIQSFTYDERGLLYSCVCAAGSPAQSTDQFNYTLNGKLGTANGGVETPGSGSSTAFAYDGFDRLASVIDAMGNVTTCAHDRNGNLVYSRVDAESVDVPGSTGNHRYSECQWQYDGLNRCVQFTEAFFDPATQSPIGSGVAVSTCAYAPNGECVSETDSLGHTTTYAYDTACRLTGVTDPVGDTSVFSWDPCGNLTAINQQGIARLNQDAQAFTVTGSYDAWNRCVSCSDNVGNTASCAYDSLDRVLRETDPNGNDTTYTYDLLDNCLSSTCYVGSSSFSPATIVSSGHAAYDNSSRCTSSSDANGNTTTYNYDSLDRCVAVTSPIGTTHTFSWNARSDLIVEQDANGTTISNTYDLCHKIIHRDIAARGAAVAATTFETFAYDGCSQLVTASNDVSSMSFSYDSLGDSTGSSQDGLAQSATHDSEGNLLSLTYPSGRVVTYSYDALNQVINIATTGGGVSHPHLAQFAYAGPGRLATIGRDNGINTLVDWDGLVSPANPAGDYGSQQASRVRHGTTASPSLLADIASTYDRMQSKSSQADAVSGRSTTLTFDALDQLVESSVHIGGAPLLDTVYTLDGDGNRQQVITNGVPMSDYTMSNMMPPGDFEMNRYTSTPFGNQQYDANGNLVARGNAGDATYYYYDYADRLVEVDALGGLGTVSPVATFTYDALGDRISKTTYPPSPGVPVTTQYVYGDPDSDNDGILESRQFGSLIDSYIHKLDDGVTIARFNAGAELAHYLCDDFGSALALTDSGGNVLERYAYDDYGQPQFLAVDGTPLVDSGGLPVTSSPAGNPFLFHGMEWDGETGLLGDGGGNYFDPQTACAIRGKVKSIKDNGTGGRAICPGGGGGVFAIEPRDILETFFETGDIPTQDQVSRNILKSFFVRGDKPTASQFGTLIDSMVNRLDDRNLIGLRVSGLAGNNPWSGGGGNLMQKGTVKFFNEAKGFGMVVGDGSKTHTKTGHVTLMK